MIKVAVWESADGGVVISADIAPKDEVIEIPEKLFANYLDAAAVLSKYEQMIVMFAREQERQRAYADE